MKLYGTPPTRAIRAMWLLNELDHRLRTRAGRYSRRRASEAGVPAINPAGKLPVLIDGDMLLTESAAIQLYLAEKYPHKRLIPEDLSERGQMYRWIFFLVTEIEQPLWRIALQTQLYPETQRALDDVPLATRDCKRMVSVFEKHMQDREFVAGERLTVADFNAAYTLDWANEAGMLGDAPRLRAYVETMYERPTAPPTISEGFAALNT